MGTYQQTGSTSIISLFLKLDHQVRSIMTDGSKYLGQTVSGALLSIETTPVGSGLGVVPVQDDVGGPSSSSLDSVADVDAEPVSLGSGFVKLRDGQHSGRSSEQPTKGTSKDTPSGKFNMVKWAMLHLGSGEQGGSIRRGWC